MLVKFFFNLSSGVQIWNFNGYLSEIIGDFSFFQDILDKIQPLSPRVLIVDSIQTVYLQGVTGSAGGISQVNISSLY